MTFRILLASTAISLLLGVAAPALSESAAPTATGAYSQTTDTYMFPLGDLGIIALSDGTVPQDLHALLTGTSPAEVDEHLNHAFLSNPVEASINGFLIRDGERLTLVDTGSGQLFGPGYGGKLRDSLASIGVMPQDITDILITHIHTDHTGGLVADGKPVFDNATVHVGAPDLTFFLDTSNSEKTGYARQYFDEAEKTIGVYQRAGKVRTFSDHEAILPGIVATLHPGHTPGSAFFTVSSKGHSIAFIGDVIHVAAVQFPDPAVTIVYDVNPGEAAAERQKTFSAFADARQLVAAPHLPFPGVGHIRAEGGGSFTWHPAEYRNREGSQGQ
ncbi:MAG: MBL fold metallo-hydrolase [Mesorhizobium sp.]|uniref:MBL fold metallo-hydrolase n=1 Tax=unclassified Mesorhizobium TaxID=325217 RepID=UPI000FCC9783|nr:MULTISPECIES: MBL fold metallo-hydrolase [unclassified Mesorhizobium]RUV70680.1 MBL fold metallo-hydrolase [Mesorhizobium sp. M5C.F.Cr.IN.023.01.1.1]RWF90084.1 MAG: MBL fold metallo-hydrolase [Mesorhizobium sp.]RWF92733.1 MAG: MBL fold metallo-hydrolase [Mesorhizobium sp.]RWI41859.1 MAG: MBL fold metallo-hydrolase [Mesorhizobium sp.]RWI51020.1 MAG: MBL fold metallo-hydrolase [Mesorhizobium sp.]